MYFCTFLSPIGNLTLAADDYHLKGLWIEGQKYFGGKYKVFTDSFAKSPVLNDTKLWLCDYFACKKPDVALLPLSPEGSCFQKNVWNLLLDIPYGETVTYGDLSKKLGKEKMSAQAVGGAVGHNPISIIIPCHRVIGANKSLTGYAGGIHIKRKLLEHEGIIISDYGYEK